ncbi:MAG: serine protease DegQ [Methylophilaceae bacterium]
MAINRKQVINSVTMLNLIAVLEPNKNAVLTIMRAGTQMDVDTLIGKRPSPVANKD